MTPSETLAQIRSKFLDVPAGFALQAERARLRLVHAKMLRSWRNDFGSSWLPGPLSYPWLLMLVAMPKVIQQLFLQC